MVFIKGMKPTKGFTGKKHSDYSRKMMSITRKENHPTKKFICTECGGSAYIGYTAKNKKSRNGLIKKGERLCLACGNKRLGGLSFL